MLWFYIAIFLISCVLLYFSGEWVVSGLMRIARFLGWREFIVAFFVMAFGASLPNFFIGAASALHKIPQLSFGDVAGNNLVALTLAVALAILFSKNKEISAENKTVQTTSIFTVIAAILPLILILDHELSRIDGVLLIAFFIFYFSWIFSKKERFTKIYNKFAQNSGFLHDTPKMSFFENFKRYIQDLKKVFFGLALLLISTQGIVYAAKFFAGTFNLPLIFTGVLITGLGSSLPEIYFAVLSAKKGETGMILGDLMGAVIVPATLVLGVVALICPIKILDFSTLVIARFFLIISALFFLFFVKTHQKITQRESFFLLLLYIIFVGVEILKKYH